MASLEEKRLLAAAVTRRDKLARQKCFDAFSHSSVPTEAQQEFLDALGKIPHRYVRGGNQCKPAYSQVKMADGSYKAIAEIVVGDEVFVNTNETAKVIKTWHNGKKRVYRYNLADGNFTHSTPNHQMPQSVEEGYLNKKEIGKCTYLLSVKGNTFKKVDITSVAYQGIMNVYDITVDHPSHTYICDGIHTGNSGKTQVASREAAWLFSGTHPTFNPKEKWGDEPLQMLILGRTTKQIEETIWKKISAFLEPNSFKAQYQGGVLQKVTHLETGNTILFLSHHNENEAREKAQSFVLHYVWIDEMPGNVKTIEELHRRVQAKKGFFTATFTPKVINRDIQKLVDSAVPPLASSFILHMFDNPIYDETDKANILASLSSYDREYQETILAGGWLTPDEQVYQFDYEKMCQNPNNYSPSQRHVSVVDPAVSSKFGAILVVEDPVDSTWTIIRDDYIEKLFAPKKIFEAAMEVENKTNIVRRICDPHESWYIGHAREEKVNYMVPQAKTDSRKAELIINLQNAFSTGKLKVAPWCGNLLKELANCRWSDSGNGKIVNSSSFHLLDCCQYFVDCMPPPDITARPRTWQEQIMQENRERKRMEVSASKQAKNKPGRVKRKLRVWR